MNDTHWLNILGWGEDQLRDLRMTGFSMLQQGHYQKAAIYFEGLAFLDPKNVYDRRTLGALYLQMGIDDKALKELDAALSIDPSHEQTLLNKAKALFMLGKINEGISVAKKLQHSPNVRLSGDASALILAYS